MGKNITIALVPEKTFLLLSGGILSKNFFVETWLIFAELYSYQSTARAKCEENAFLRQVAGPHFVDVRPLNHLARFRAKEDDKRAHGCQRLVRGFSPIEVYEQSFPVLLDIDIKNELLFIHSVSVRKALDRVEKMLIKYSVKCDVCLTDQLKAQVPVVGGDQHLLESVVKGANIDRFFRKLPLICADSEAGFGTRASQPSDINLVELEFGHQC